MPVVIHSQRSSTSEHYLPQHQHVAMRVFLIPKLGSWYGTRSIINAGYQHQAWTSTFQPIMWAGVHLQQYPLLWVSLPSRAVAGCSALTWAFDTCLREDVTHGGATKRYVLVLGQQLT